MSGFDLFPAEAATKLESGRAVDLNAGAGVFEGAATAPFTGLAAGATGFARTLNLGMTPIAAAVDQALGSNTRDWWLKNMMLERTARRFTPNPREVGVAGQILHSLFDVGGQAVAAGPAGVLVAQTIEKSMQGVEQGLDVGTAMRKGAIEGGSAALGVALPIAMPYMVGSRIPGLVQQLGYGVAANVPLGIASRGLTHKVLADAGYADMAEQYKALDETGLMTDFVLGAAFGGLGHAITEKGAKLPLIRPADIDAALAKRNAYHLEVDTAPGLARNGETRDAHVDAVLKATEDLMAGKPVDVSAELRATDFHPMPALDAQRAELARATAEVAAPIRKALTEAEIAGQSPDFIESRRQLSEIEHHVAQLEDQARSAYDAGKHDEVGRLRGEIDALRAEQEHIDQQSRANLQALIDREKKSELTPKAEPLGAGPAPQVEQVHAALKAEGLDTSAENVSKVRSIALARSLDAAAVDALSDTMPDGEYMAKIGEIIDAKQSAQAPDKGGAPARAAEPVGAGAEARPKGEQRSEAAGRGAGEAKPGGEDTRLIDEAEVRAAENIATQYPEMFVTLEDGTTLSAQDAIQLADAAIAKAQLDAKGYDAAIMCALRVGE